MRSEVRFAGFGGQGIISAGKIAGRAASIYGGKNAVMMQSYGPEARGGACNADLVVSDGVIGYPRLSQPSVLVIMSQEAYEKYGQDIDSEGLLIVDEDLVDFSELPPPVSKVYGIPATRLADALGRKIVANVVMLGALAAISEIVSREAMLDAILNSVPARTKELNERAFSTGYAKGEEALGEQP
ncbi:2-oxoacid:acceptor oxidoreductase family protein [Candidatus Bipolaricaulota bacterium]|nr:2-oxoacid:acceptor oxidoreductase family protein [Candidatus Bipolaricaulota bacterium]